LTETNVTAVISLLVTVIMAHFNDDEDDVVRAVCLCLSVSM